MSGRYGGLAEAKRRLDASELPDDLRECAEWYLRMRVRGVAADGPAPAEHREAIEWVAEHVGLMNVHHVLAGLADRDTIQALDKLEERARAALDDLPKGQPGVKDKSLRDRYFVRVAKVLREDGESDARLAPRLNTALRLVSDALGPFHELDPPSEKRLRNILSDASHE